MTATLTTQETQSFKYKPLIGTDIRVLVIRPSQTKSSPVLCSIVHRPLERYADCSNEKALPYEALSYTWGPNSGTHTIWLSNREDPSHTPSEISVTDNLHAALVSLRLTDRERHIWVDALCINQEDDQEKDRQILRMLRIYQSAERVVIWLGDETPNTEVAMRHLGELEGQWEYRQARNKHVEVLIVGYEIALAFVELIAFVLLCFLLLVWRQLFFSAAIFLGWHCILTKALGNAWSAWFAYVPLFGCQVRYSFWLLLGMPAAINQARQILSRFSPATETLGDDILDGLTDLFSRSWFTRIWIVQEASAANQNALVVCGSHQINWNTLVAACSELRALTKGCKRSPYARTGYQQARHVLDALRLDRISPDDPFLERRLLVLLCRLHTQQATVLHDKVFALLGMSVEIQEQEQKATGHSDSVVSIGVTPFMPNSMEPLEITYCRTARFLIESSGNLRVFRACMGERALESLPSWVPDWSTPCWRNLDDLVMPYSLGRLADESNGQAVAKIADDLKTVTVRGVIFGSLFSGPSYTDIPTAPTERLEMEVYLRITMPLAWLITSPRAWDVLAVLWRFVMLALGASGPEIAEGWELDDLIRDGFLGVVNMSAGKTLQIPMNEDAVPGVFHMKGRFAQFVARSSFDLLSGVDFTVSTFVKDPRVGDRIVLLEGADIPFLLRPRDSAGERWEMVGPAVFKFPIERAFWKRYAGKERGVELREFVLD
ncbi:Heterokaryon incompatibility protein (HET) domain containing protein [Naviculisporaceae sp. PSN 640]